MRLILSCITKGEGQLRGMLDRLAQAGIAKQSIVVLHPGADVRSASDRRSAQAASIGHSAPAGTATATAGAAAEGGGLGGMFGWLVGYGVLSVPGALLGGAVGAVAGATISAIGAARHSPAPHHVTEDVQHHYASRIVDDHAAVLVQVQEMQQYQTVLMAFLDEGGRHILTSRNNPAMAESAQLEALVHHPAMVDGRAAESGPVPPAARDH